MLCRALLAAVVLSCTLYRGNARAPTLDYIKDVLCVLLLSGVQKEDLDAGTLRKLQRHNVNIDDINDQKLRDHCYGKTDVPITLTTLTIETSTKKTITTKETPDTDKNIESLVGGTTQLEKIVEYLENKYKDQKIKAVELKDNTLKLTPLTTLPPNTFRNDHEQRIEFENPDTEKLVLAVTNNDDEKNNKNKELKKLMKVWQTNIDRLSDATQQESTTIQIIKDEPVPKNTKDIEYISKIVAEIMSKRQLDEVKTATLSPQNNLNETFQDADLSAVQNKNKTVLPANYYLNNCNLGNFYASKQGEKEKKEIFVDLYNRVSYGGNVPDTATKSNNNYVTCKRVDELKDNKPLHSDRVDEKTINYIITKLKKEGQRFNILDNESAKAFETSSENQPKSIPFNRQSTNIDRGRLNILDNESAKALETVLENQSKNIIFNRQSDPINASNIYSERLNLFENDSTKVFKTAVDKQPKSIFFGQQSRGVETTKANKEKNNNYARFVEENKRVWEQYFALRNMQETELDDEQTESIINRPNFHHETAKQGDHALDEEYKRWLLTFHKPINKQESMMETKQNSFLNNRANDHEKSSNTLNSVPDEPYDANFGYQYKRPWLYGGVSSEQSKAGIKGTQDKILFKPKFYEKLINTFVPRHENAYEKKIPPYFEPAHKNNSIIPIRGREMPKNNRQSILDDINSPQLVQQNYWERSREFIDASKKYSDFIGWYQNKTPFNTEYRSPKQFEYKGDKELNKGRMQTGHHNQIIHLPEGGYKTDWAYFRNKQSKKQFPNIEEHDEETEYFINTKSSKEFRYQYPPKPYEVTPKIPLLNIDTAKNDFTNYISKYNISNDNEKNRPSFLPNVIKDIANSVKELVLRDLKTTTSKETTVKTTTPTTTTATPTTTTTTATTTTPTTTSTTRTTTTETTTTTTTTPTTTTTTATTTKSTVTDGALITTAKADQLKVQDASKALEKIMEIFEKISSMKDKIVKLDNVKTTERVRHEKTTSRYLIIQNQEPAQFKPEARLSNEMQPTEMKAENRIRYPENLTPYSLPQKQQKPENFIPYSLPFIQRTPENSIPYGMKSPYYHSKIEYDPYVANEVLEDATRKIKVKQAPRGHAITVQTNSGEIAPLKIALHKPGIQNVVLTTKPPKKEASSDEILKYRKPTSSSSRHQVDNIRETKESSHRDISDIPRHTHRDAYMGMPKSRKIIKSQRAFTEQYKPRDFPDIEGFHEKLEKGHSWGPFEESRIPKRMQRPLAKNPNYDDTHFRNFLHTQQKVNAMLEKILSSAKTTPMSAEII